MQNYCSGKKAYIDEIAATYEEDRKSEHLWHIEQVYMEKVISLLPEESSILDIPVGTGRFLDIYQKKNNHVVGVDVSQAMLNEACNKIVSKHIHLELGDAEALKYPDCRFEYVFCWRLLHLVPHDVLRTVISEIARVSSQKIYLQAYVHDSYFFLLKLKELFLRKICFSSSAEQSKQSPWSHIQSFAHKESLLLDVFSELNLKFCSVDILGNYGPLRVKVYVLEKMSSS